MKATGIVRRIDDLGRVVIPKEVRRALRVRAGDPLEIFYDKDMVGFKPYIADAYSKTLEDVYAVLNSFDFRIAVLNSYGCQIAGTGDIHIDAESWYEYNERCFPIYDRLDCGDTPIGFVWVKEAIPNVDRTAKIKTVIEVFEKLFEKD